MKKITLAVALVLGVLLGGTAISQTVDGGPAASVAQLAAPTKAEAHTTGFYWESGYNWDGTWITCLHSGTHPHLVLFCY